jgi:hypothetical protein
MLQMPGGCEAAGRGEHRPRLLGSAQLSQGESHARSQQTPSTQWPLAHWLGWVQS